MANTTPQDLSNQLHWRTAVKLFDPTKIVGANEWQALEEALILTPSSYGLQPWKFVIVTDTFIKGDLQKCSWNQPQVRDCSHLVVFLAKTQVDEAYVDHFIDDIVATRDSDRAKLEGYRKSMLGDIVHGPRSKWVREWAVRQVYIALGNLMTSAALLGVDTCPLEGIEPEKYDEILELKNSGYETCVACAVGYRSEQDIYSKLKKVRFSAEELILKK